MEKQKIEEKQTVRKFSDRIRKLLGRTAIVDDGGKTVHPERLVTENVDIVAELQKLAGEGFTQVVSGSGPWTEYDQRIVSELAVSGKPDDETVFTITKYKTATQGGFNVRSYPVLEQFTTPESFENHVSSWGVEYGEPQDLSNFLKPDEQNGTIEV